MQKESKLSAAIDLGSNTFRLVIAKVKDKKITPVIDEIRPVKLANQMGSENILAPSSIQRATTALKEFAETIKQYQPAIIKSYGTAVFRYAKNSQEFIDLAEKILPCRIKIISGQEEAAFSSCGVLAGITKETASSTLIIDVGGGSTELIRPEDSMTSTGRGSPAPVKAISIPVGAVNMTEQYLSDQENLKPGLQKLSCFLDDTIIQKMGRICRNGQQPDRLIACGGTATALATLDLALPHYNSEKIQNHTIPIVGLENIIEKLLRLPRNKLKNIPGLTPGRGEILLAGTMIFLSIMRSSRIPLLLISDNGLVEGILLSASN